MRTTVRLPDDLHARARRHAEAQGMTFTDLLEESLRMVLDPVATAAEERGAYRVHPLPTGDGAHCDVNLDDNAAVRDRMDGR